MKTVVHRAETRGHANHGWLDAHHSFSFARWYDPTRVHFGTLRVLNDDRIAPGRGFDTHPHDNMEIITIPLSGSLKHRDSMGNEGVIKAGEVQVMSAGSGVAHSEFNASKEEPTSLLQIWVFTKTLNVTPQYGQRAFPTEERLGDFQTVVAPFEETADTAALRIHQDAWFSLGSLQAGTTKTYTLRKAGNGVYLFVIKGKIRLGAEELQTRDGVGITETDSISLDILEDAEILVMDIPMALPPYLQGQA